MSIHGLYVLNMTFPDLPAKKYANLQRSTGFLNNMILSTKPKKALLAYRFTCYQGKFTLFSHCTVCVRPCVLSKSNLLAVSFETTSEIAGTFTCDLGGFAPVSKLLGWDCVYASNLRKT